TKISASPSASTTGRTPGWASRLLISEPNKNDVETTVSTLRDLFTDTVNRQLVADVPVCTLLSGGLDSSAITTIAAAAFRKMGSGPLHTYSIDYAENDLYFKSGEFQPNSDAEWVDYVSRYCGTEHHNVIVDTPELVDALMVAMRAKDMPGMADIDSSLYLFCSQIKEQATVALSGECADEIFGGYPWFHNQQALSSDLFPWCRDLSTRTSIFSPELIAMTKPREYMSRRYQETLAQVPALPGERPYDARIREMFYLNINWFMATLLDRKDRMSMATGLEVRVPFADHRLVEYAWNIPWQMKNLGGREKGVLRKALQGLLPEEVLYRKKSPYPKTHHPAYRAAVADKLLAILNDPASPLLPLINQAAIREMIDNRDGSFARPWFGQLMTDAQLFAFLLQTNAWLTEYRVSII
ncbi:MAG TPA: asparagine synthase C-terminal domain-containing protein, partial [Bacillota bacterium]|nr:asparagine synthase C-terminal domain-containing protein [Bacillota bacterium]